MDKIYKITLVCLLVILFLANIVFFVYDGKFVSYFETKDELETAQNILNTSELNDLEGDLGLFNLAILENEKYQNLKDFKFDFDDFSLPGDTNSEDGAGQEQEGGQPEKEPEFEVGNSNPFSPSF
ncbi:MAG TPA: hypothetical protein PK142_00950 [bacterium]|nr:hypothetical protein [bacterium]